MLNLCEPSFEALIVTLLPDPVCGEGVGQHVEAGEHDEGLEVAALGHGARHDGGGQRGQRQLVEEGEGALRRGAVQPVRLIEELAPACNRNFASFSQHSDPTKSLLKEKEGILRGSSQNIVKFREVSLTLLQ